MKKWVEKLIEQFDFEVKESTNAASSTAAAALSEERATLLYMIDVYNKHLLEIEGQPVRKVREILDEFGKELLQPLNIQRTLFRFRQFFAAYRIDETSYLQKTFEEFRSIVWELADQLSMDLSEEQKEDFQLRKHLEQLKDAVESNSIDTLKQEARNFIDCYVEKQVKKDQRNHSRMNSIRHNLDSVKKQLTDANHVMRLDHLTKAYNRKSFDEYCAEFKRLHNIAQQPVSLIVLDIDYFKRINDVYGHPMGDFCLKELVQILKASFQSENAIVARIGGEEFGILLSKSSIDAAVNEAEQLLRKVRAEIFVHENQKINFTISIGVAQLMEAEPIEAWLKRADAALYHSKNTGRNRLSVAPGKSENAA